MNVIKRLLQILSSNCWGASQRCDPNRAIAPKGRGPRAQTCRDDSNSWQALSCQSLRASWEIIQFSNSTVFHSALLCQGNPERHFTASSCLQLLPLTTFSTGGVVWALAISEAKENFERCRTCCSVLSFWALSVLCEEQTLTAGQKTGKRLKPRIFFKEAELSSPSLSVWLYSKSESQNPTSKSVLLLQNSFTLKITVLCRKQIHAVALWRMLPFSLWGEKTLLLLVNMDNRCCESSLQVLISHTAFCMYTLAQWKLEALYSSALWKLTPP